MTQLLSKETGIGSPRAWGVPHDTWRPSQKKAFIFARNIREMLEDAWEDDSLDEISKFVFLELPTGSGKSGVATALGAESPILVLVHTLGLLDQYKEQYGFSIIKGRQEYPCADKKKINEWLEQKQGIPTARDCHHSKMHECKYQAECPYLLAKAKAISAQRAACTYRYAALSKSMQDRHGIIVLDEAHSAADEWIDFASFEINEDKRLKYDLPNFPFPFGYGDYGKGAPINAGAFQELTKWFEKSIAATSEYKDSMGIENSKKRNFNLSLQSIYRNLLNGTEYFLKTGNDIAYRTIKSSGQSKRVSCPGMELKALDASDIAKKVWGKKEMVIFMSATIGSPEPIARELGIREKPHFKTFGHPIEPEKRPVHNLGAHRMTNSALRANPSLYKIQAILIRSFINDILPEYGLENHRGLILTSSYKKIDELSRYMSEWFPGRLFDPYRKIRGVSERITEFIADPRPDIFSIETIQGWGHGLDFKGDLARWLVVAGIHFGNPTDPYVQARRKKEGGGNFYFYTAYNGVVQGAGRIVRGTLDENGEYIVNVTALADGSAFTTKAMQFYPEWFKESII